MTSTSANSAGDSADIITAPTAHGQGTVRYRVVVSGLGECVEVLSDAD